MHKTNFFIFFINISFLSLPFFLTSSESPFSYPKKWEKLSLKEIADRYRKKAIKYCKKVELPNEKLVPMWCSNILLVLPTEKQAKIISTLGLNTCVAAMVHVLFHDKTQFAALLHTSTDNTDSMSDFAYQCSLAAAFHKMKPIKSIELFTSIPESIDINDHEFKKLITHPLYSKFEELMSNMVNQCFENNRPITVKNFKHPSVRVKHFKQNDCRNLKMILHPDHSYLEQAHSNYKIPLLTDAYFEKIEKADFTLACKLIKDYHEKK